MTAGNSRSTHRDRWWSPLTRDETKLIERMDHPDDLMKLRLGVLKEKYADGYDNGYVWTTPEHEDGECERFRPGPLKEVKIR